MPSFGGLGRQRPMGAYRTWKSLCRFWYSGGFCHPSQCWTLPTGSLAVFFTHFFRQILFLLLPFSILIHLMVIVQDEAPDLVNPLIETFVKRHNKGKISSSPQNWSEISLVALLSFVNVIGFLQFTLSNPCRYFGYLKIYYIKKKDVQPCQFNHWNICW